MLPTATRITEKFDLFIQDYMRRVAHSEGMLQGISHHVMHEGKAWRLERPDGTTSESELESHGHEMTIKFDELPRFGFQQAMEKARELAVAMRNQAERMMIRTLETDLPESQQTQSNRPFDHETVFEALEKIQIDFDKGDDGASQLTMVVHPDMIPKLEKLSAEFEASEDLKRRHEDIMRRKKEEYREREARRRLVG
ncbi:MAG: hypothetical protein M0D54_17215 [Hyphomonadaceae bacterium JAD_PAG50586_4]|nr:MAG: hypothetical protein M0D54_17215 [Hyphomonadaceae bacterium JAD_PAG50586_4]